MNTTDQPSDNHKKEPSPTTETVSSISKIPKHRYTASEQEEIETFRKKLQYEAWVPATLFVGDWREPLGKAYPLLCVLLCSANWKTGLWRGKAWVLAAVFNVSVRTIGDWISRIKKLEGVEYHRYPYSIQLIFPPRMRTRFAGMKEKSIKDRHE